MSAVIGNITHPAIFNLKRGLIKGLTNWKELGGYGLYILTHCLCYNVQKIKIDKTLVDMIVKDISVVKDSLQNSDAGKIPLKWTV